MSTAHTDTSAAILRSFGESSAGAIIFALDRNYQYTYFNRRHLSVMQAIWGECITEGLSILDVIKRDEDRAKAKANFDRALRGETFTLIEAYGDEALQRSYWENIYAPVLVGDKEIIGLIVQVTDVTTRTRNAELVKEQQRTLEQMVTELRTEVAERTKVQVSLAGALHEIERSRDAAERANRAKSAFLANMSHELRTPLNAILGFAQLMGRGSGMSQEQRDNLGIIHNSGQHLLALINDVLEMSRIEAGGLGLHESAFELHRLIHEIEDMFRLRVSEKGLSFDVTGVATVPQHVRADESKLRQILINLLGNAVKFTQEGGVSLRLQRGEESLITDKTEVIFEIEDTGAGIDDSEIEKIFLPFVQARAGIQSQQGTGLGLPLSRQFARLMNGDISAKSGMKGGALFTAKIWLSKARPDEVPEPKQTRRISNIAPGQPEYRILIAEDRWENRKLLELLLTPLGFLVRSAANGEEAIKIWREWHPSLILMDMQMPILDGYQATYEIKKSKDGARTCIIALSASAFEENRTQILASGCDDFIRKPFRPDDVIAALESHLGVRFVESFPAPREAPSQRSNEPLSMKGVPSAWLTAFGRANEQLDVQAMERLLSQLPSSHAVLAESLHQLVHDYAFEQISEVLAKHGTLQ
jgi:signal transduction histidine kinase/DNA-binding response OmpR family regulator